MLRKVFEGSAVELGMPDGNVGKKVPGIWIVIMGI